jgi:hypothetical protein
MKHLHSVLELAQLCVLHATSACSCVAEAFSLLLVLLLLPDCAVMRLLHSIFAVLCMATCRCDGLHIVQGLRVLLGSKAFLGLIWQQIRCLGPVTC